MSQFQFKMLISQIAIMNHVSYSEVYAEIENALHYAYVHQSENTQAFWSSVTDNGDEPTVYQVFAHILH